MRTTGRGMRMRLSTPDFLLIALIKTKSLLDTIGSARVQQFFHKVSSEREERTQGVAAAGRALPLRWQRAPLFPKSKRLSWICVVMPRLAREDHAGILRVVWEWKSRVGTRLLGVGEDFA